jgi:hypothetical protein
MIGEIYKAMERISSYVYCEDSFELLRKHLDEVATSRLENETACKMEQSYQKDLDRAEVVELIKGI